MGTLSPKDTREIEDSINEVKRALANPIGGSKKEKIYATDRLVKKVINEILRNKK